MRSVVGISWHSTGLGRRLNPVGSIIGLVAIAVSVSGEPFVAGYERFHGETPSKEGGAVLYSELGCANCHGDSPVSIPRTGPSLMDLSVRIQRDWVDAFLADPQAQHAGSTMPAMFASVSAEDREAVVSWLGTLGKGKAPRGGRYVNAEAGSATFHEKGCIACHAPTADHHAPGAGEFDDSLSVSLPNLKEKTGLAALAAFLSNTSAYRPDGRMPHFSVQGEQALDLAAHLLDFQSSEPDNAPTVPSWPKPEESVVQHGRAIAERLRCAACHELPDVDRPEIVEISATDRRMGHCLTHNPRSGLPRYSLTNPQRESLEAFLADPEINSTVDLSLEAMNCYACHDWNGKGGPTPSTNPYFHGEESLGDSGRLPPPLTGIGSKLREDWMKRLFEGEEETRVRPYLQTEMPAYKGQAVALTKVFHSTETIPKEIPLVEGGEIDAGRKLLGVAGGVNCITCHSWGDRRSLGIPALDISSLDQRLRPEWFRRYLLNPASYRPGTLMPPLWPGGHSTVPGILEGDTEMQIASIWRFIAEGEGVPEGFPDHIAGAFELKPTDRPIIQRAFLEGAGTKAILVGFPAGIHLAYDGAEARPALLWTGPFFDAYTTWFVRAAPMEKPLGDEIHPFAKLGGERRFRGFELDGEGNPTFLFLDAGRDVRDHFSAIERKVIRTVSWKEGSVPSVNHPEGITVVEEKAEGVLTFHYQFP